MRIFLTTAFLFLACLSCLGQDKKNEINQVDQQDRPHGLWYITTPAVRGEPEETVLGTYEHGQKNGLWYVSDGRGNMISIETFKWNVRDGEAKYFDNGRLTAIGHYRGLNPKEEKDTVLIVDPISGSEKLVYVPTERGSVRHGSWRFYDEFSGRLIREEQYQVDEMIYKKDFSISSSDSSHYQTRNRSLPHTGKGGPAGSKFKVKASEKSLIGE